MEKTNPTILISGGTKGIGKETIRKFAGQGFDIITCSRNAGDLEKLKEEIESNFDTQVFAYPTNVANKQEVFDFITGVKALGREISVLINNAGMFVPGAIHKEEEGLLESMINTNLYSAYHLSRAFIPEMKKRKSGHIFNICSIASIVAYPTGGSYSISKFAMYGLSKGLREELKPHGVRVTSVMPGATFTASWEGADVDEKRLMKAGDIAELIWATYSLSNQTVVEDLVIRPQQGDL